MVYVEGAKPLEQYTTEELYTCFHFGNADMKYIADHVRPKLHINTSTLSDVAKAVSITLASLVNQFVSLPKDDQISLANHK